MSRETIRDRVDAFGDRTREIECVSKNYLVRHVVRECPQNDGSTNIKIHSCIFGRGKKITKFNSFVRQGSILAIASIILNVLFFFTKSCSATSIMEYREKNPLYALFLRNPATNKLHKHLAARHQELAIPESRVAMRYLGASHSNSSMVGHRRMR